MEILNGETTRYLTQCETMILKSFETAMAVRKTAAHDAEAYTQLK